MVHDLTENLATKILANLESFLRPHLGDPKKDDLGGSFSELGVDSFILIELVLYAEREYGVKLPLDRVGACNSLPELQSIILDTYQTSPQQL